jgi:beta-glucosidase
VAGAEVPQVYLAGLGDSEEPPQRLVGWEKVSLNAGEARRVNIVVSPMMRRVWDSGNNTWRVATNGCVEVGASSRDIRLKQ